jgi:periplasmic protein TonB
MPAELFHPSISSVGARRRAALLPLSIAAHAVLLAAWFIVPLFATQLPDPPSRAMAAYVQVALPPPPAPPAHHEPASPKTAAANPAFAPTEAPPKIVPERAPEAPESGFEARGAVDGIPGAIPMKVEAAPPPPPPPADKKPLRPGGVIQAPRKIKDVAPIYPQIAQSARREGTVIIEAIIGEDGRVEQTRVLRSVALLDEAALSAVRQWVFTPTRLNGEPVPVVMTVTVTFHLQ